jgi:methyl-accepting chemotaxis protein
MSLKKLFLILFGIQLVLVAATGVVTLMLFQNQGNLNSARETQFQSYLLADELRQSSDDLTRLARAFVATGSAEYEREYWTILDIRNGKAPRPIEYNRIYWDFVAATGQKPRGDGETIALQELMKKEGFTQEEFAKLTEAQKNSDGLVKAETIAMNAVKGLFDDGSGNFTVKKAPDRQMAIDLMFNADYHKNKAKIMQPIDDFYVLFQTRTQKDVEKFQQLSTQLLVIILVLIVLTALMVVLSFVMIQRQVTDPLQKVATLTRLIAETDLRAFTSEIDLIAKGDLTRTAVMQNRQIQIHSNNEVGQTASALELIIKELQNLNRSFSVLTSNFRKVLIDVNQNAREVNEASMHLATTASQAEQATSQIAATIQQVAKGVSQQTDMVSKTATSAEQMTHVIDSVARGAEEQSRAVNKASSVTAQINLAIQQVATSANQSAEGATKAAETARSGAKTVNETIKGMETIKAKVDLSAKKVQEMGKRSDQIGAIVETIDDIASQTNLLALNAAIEAARAGEHGKGFAVVADEVRKLAERSSIATKEIGGLIREIQKTVAEAVSAMNEGAVEVENGVSRANQAGNALNSILTAVETVTRQVEGIATEAHHISASSNDLVSSVDTVSVIVQENTNATHKMSANSTQVAQAVENIASVSEENSAAVEEVSASTEEMTAQVDEVSSYAMSLAEMAGALEKLVNQFRLN